MFALVPLSNKAALKLVFRGRYLLYHLRLHMIATWWVKRGYRTTYIEKMVDIRCERNLLPNVDLDPSPNPTPSPVKPNQPCWDHVPRRVYGVPRPFSRRSW